MFKHKAQLSHPIGTTHPTGFPQTSSRPCRPHPPAARVSKAPAVLPTSYVNKHLGAPMYTITPLKKKQHGTWNAQKWWFGSMVFPFPSGHFQVPAEGFGGVYNIYAYTVYPYLCIYTYIYIYIHIFIYAISGPEMTFPWSIQLPK